MFKPEPSLYNKSLLRPYPQRFHIWYACIFFSFCFCDLLFCVIKCMQGHHGVHRHQSPVHLPCSVIFLIRHGHYPNTAILLIQFFIVFFQSDPVSDYTVAHTSYTGQDQAYITSESVLILNIIYPSGRFAGLEGPGTKVYQSTHNHVRISGKQDTPYWFLMPRNDTEGRIRTKCFEVVRHFLDPIPGRFL